MTTKNINSISTKTVFGKVTPKDIAAAPEQKLAVMRVIGIASGFKTGEGNDGPWTALQGTFEASNFKTGEVISASMAFLPSEAMNAVLGSVKLGRAVEFAYDIHAEIEETAPAGYIYRATSLLKEEHNPLAALKGKMKVPAVAAPTETKPATSKEKAK